MRAPIRVSEPVTVPVWIVTRAPPRARATVRSSVNTTAEGEAMVPAVAGPAAACSAAACWAALRFAACGSITKKL